MSMVVHTRSQAAQAYEDVPSASAPVTISPPATEVQPSADATAARAHTRKRAHDDDPPFSAPPTMSPPAMEVDRSVDATAVRAYTHRALAVECANCGETRQLSEADIVKLSDSMIAQPPDACLCCALWDIGVCTLCGTQFPPYTEDDVLHSDQCNNPQQSAPGRLELIWLLLCGYDDKANRSGSQKSISTRLSEKAKRCMESGVGYGGNQTYVYRNSQASTLLTTASADDTNTGRVMQILTMLLPSKSRTPSTKFDLEPPAVLSSMLLKSFLLDRTAELLRNDSLEVVASQEELYRSTFSFVTALTDHVGIFERTILAPRPSTGQALLQVSFGKPITLPQEEQEGSQSIASSLATLSTQASLMLGSAEANKTVFETKGGQKTLQLCRDIKALADGLQRRASEISANAVTVSEQKPNKDTESDLAFLDMPDEDILLGHAFARKARQMRQRNNNSMATLIKHVNSLKTSLPPGIFVRYASSRPDVMKILIVGPRDTPYENGLFEFDLFCGSNYPHGPPTMSFKTTGRGTVSFNPNLYSNGFICLSLLGTWEEGETWDPHQSTLLQLLVSVQAMIFCEEPYCNEPGREDNEGSGMSQGYNRRLYPSTIKHAMLAWFEGGDENTGDATIGDDSIRDNTIEDDTMQDDTNDENIIEDHASGDTSTPLSHGADGQEGSQSERNAGIWDDVVQKHIQTNEKQILGTVAKWVEDVKDADVRKAPRSRKGTPKSAQRDLVEGSVAAGIGPVAEGAVPLTTKLKEALKAL